MSDTESLPNKPFSSENTIHAEVTDEPPQNIQNSFKTRLLQCESVSCSTENIFQNLQGYIRRGNHSLMRRLSYQALTATNDFDTFKQWVYQDLDKHKTQLKEVGSSLLFRNENKSDIFKFDVVITFNAKCDQQFIDEFQELLKLNHPNIKVDLREHDFSKYVEYALYLGATDAFLEQHIDVSFRDQIVHHESESDSSNETSTPFRYYPLNTFLSSLQRQSILARVLHNWLYIIPNQTSPETNVKFPCLSKYLDTRVAVMETLISAKLIDQFFPLHHEDDLTMLKQCWVTKLFESQPLEKICDYFGMKIAIYFAFIGFYTRSLLFPTFFGIFITYFSNLILYFNTNFYNLFHYVPSIDLLDWPLLNDVLLFTFTIFNIFWSTFMLQKWEQKCQVHVSSWEDKMPENICSPNKASRSKCDSGATKEQCRMQHLMFKYFVTFPVIGLSLIGTFTVMFHIFNLQTWWDLEVIEQDGYPNWTRFIPKILLAIVINFSNYVYYVIAQWLNHKEKHHSAESKENMLIFKLVLFQFLNSFLPLLYIAFYLGDVDKLHEQLATQLITRQVIGNFNEAVWPLLKETYRLATRKLQNRDLISGKSLLSKGELESCMYPYVSTFDDYLELVIQFGYVMLFAPVFPLAALCAFLNNLIEIRSDAFKLCIVYQRPFGHQNARTIGAWANVMHYLSIVAITINCALMVLTGQISRLFAFQQQTQVILTGVVIEHILLLMKWLIPTFYLH